MPAIVSNEVGRTSNVRGRGEALVLPKMVRFQRRWRDKQVTDGACYLVTIGKGEGYIYIYKGRKSRMPVRVTNRGISENGRII